MNPHPDGMPGGGTRTFRDTTGILLLLGIVLIAATMRAPLTCVGPLVDDIRASLTISNATAGMITTLPLLIFSVFSLFAPVVGRLFGDRLVLFLSLLLLTAGIAVRSASGLAALFAGTFLIGLGIAICNVLVPAVVKHEFPLRTGLVTGLYAISMNIFSAIASGVSVPLSSRPGWGWTGALGVWVALAAAATVLWLPQLKHNCREAFQSIRMVVVQGGEEIRQSGISMWRSPLAWKVTVFMGLQSLLFYSLVAWLPKIYVERGMDMGTAGWMLSLVQVAQIPFSFVASVLANRLSDQRGLVLAGGAAMLLGIGGILFGGTSLVAVWMIALGAGGGLFFGVALMFFSLRTESTSQAAKLSGMAQAVGYLLAAIGPTFIGYLYDISGEWTNPLAFLTGAAIVCSLCGLGAGKGGKVRRAR